MSDEVDMVNHPPHYAETVPGIETIEVTEHFNFNRGNAIKYIWRAGAKDKDAEIQDLKKAAWYINREIEKLENEKAQIEIPISTRRMIDEITGEK